MNLPWIVYFNDSLSSTDDGVSLSKVSARFGTRVEAEMHRQSLNRLTKSCKYKVCFDNQS